MVFSNLRLHIYTYQPTYGILIWRISPILCAESILCTFNIAEVFVLKHLFMSAILALLPLSGQSDTLRYEAIWSSGSGTNIVTGPQSRADFITTGTAQTAAGRRLVDVETALVNGNRIYTGLWVGGTGSNLFEGPIGPIQMRTSMNTRRGQGLRLIDFEIIRPANGGRRYLAVWRPGQGEELLTGPMGEAAFLARGQNLVDQRGMRLIDVEVERVNGQLLYSGLFRSGSGTNLITTPLNRTAFIRRRDEFVARGIELVDVETIRMGGRTRFVGVWAGGNGESRLSVPRIFRKFVDFGVAQTAEGFRTEDMELRVQRTSTPPDTEPTPPGTPDPDGPTTADLPSPPPWLVITDSGNPNVVMDFMGPFVSGSENQPFRLTIHRSLLPDYLPLNAEGQPVIPDAFCGLRIFHPSSSFWEDQNDEIDTGSPFLHIPEYTGQPLETNALAGIDFTGPMGQCEGSNEAWQFFNPLTQDSTGGPPPARRLVVELADRIEFLNFNIHAGEGLDPHELFGNEVFATLEAIAKAFEETQIDNGYCQGVSSYMAELCNENPGLCPVADPQAGC